MYCSHTQISKVSGLVKHHQVTKEALIISGSKITATQVTWIKLSLITGLLLHFRAPSIPFPPPSFLQTTLGEMQSGVCLLGEKMHKALRLIFQLSAECLYSLMFGEAAWEAFGVNNSILQLHSQNHCGSVTAYTTVGWIWGCQRLGVSISFQSFLWLLNILCAQNIECKPNFNTSAISQNACGNFNVILNLITALSTVCTFAKPWLCFNSCSTNNLTPTNRITDQGPQGLSC